ncbi:hypothetical protein ACQ4WX_33995 [Streptomyces lasalocidi]
MDRSRPLVALLAATALAAAGITALSSAARAADAGGPDERRLRVRPHRLDLHGRHDGRLTRAQRKFGTPGDPG